ncbi:cytidine deaminase [Tautonia plasticadhaerens]|uniref:Cytidine deaminase n=1 Tax=Tautonia plasticadhaerens TaxID=2527974 RepID=A0A518H135_9BACT|nr:cytidine deaminase [Tautonia plasticadhaerens]QDV34544.1 Cytidine deaminase [Tautonia plasticadhaerens]
MPDGLDDVTLQRMIALARQASGSAYCPYSGFAVGSAVLGEGGEIVAGCNVENASHGLTTCAERVAVFGAVARGVRSIRAVVVFTPTPSPTAPCGACRQVVYEFGPGAEIICACDGPDLIRRPLSELLPDAFGPSDLAG